MKGVYLAVVFASCFLLSIAEGRSGAQKLEHGEAENPSLRKKRAEAITTHIRTSNGPVTIKADDPEGKFISLENIGTSDVNLDGFKLTKTIDGNSQSSTEYIFASFTLRRGKSVQIWARAFADQADQYDLVFRDADTWGSGTETVATLINKSGGEVASLVTKTRYI